MKTTAFLLLLTFVVCGVNAQTQISVQDLTPLVKEYAFKEMPRLNPQTVFKIEEYRVDGLWEALRTQVFLARYMSLPGEEFNQSLLLFHEGKLTPFACALGGHGLMSGIVVDKALYYTYSWGSGIHRSHIGKLSVEDEKLKILDSGGYPDRDLFVRHTAGKVQVESGRFIGFNSWEPIAYVGTLQSKGATLIMVEEAGIEVVPQSPATKGSSQPAPEPDKK